MFLVSGLEPETSCPSTGPNLG